MEPVLNLAPVLPEEGTANQGSAAYTSMQFKNDNGAWGMFHPALALYDGQKFSEGLQFNWDTVTTANSILLDKIGIDHSGNTYPQYQWRPEFSCSGLPFNGALARPNDPAPTDQSVYPISFVKPLDYTGGGYPIAGEVTHRDTWAEENWFMGQMPNAVYTENGILAGSTGGFYPYRYQRNEMYHQEMDGGMLSMNEPNHVTPFQYEGSAEEWFGFQYNIKRLSSPGIFHPHGVVPTTEQEAFTNKNVPATGNEIKNQTSYIGGAMNTKAAGPVASYDNTKTHAPRYKYWVIRIPVSIPEYT